MRVGRSIINECMAVLRYRRALAKLRAAALLAIGTGVSLGAAFQMLVGDYDAPMFCVLFIVMLWGTFIAACGTWRLL